LDIFKCTRRILKNKNGEYIMKKYLGLGIAFITLLTMGSASAIVIQTVSFHATQTQIVTGALDGICDNGCHNETNLTEITGVLTYDDSTFMIEDTILNVGGQCFLNTISPYDFDGDGTIETRLNELLGLVGTTITVEGYPCCHDSKLKVYYINGLEYREC